jgi:Bacterial type II secretion system protein G.
MKYFALAVVALLLAALAYLLFPSVSDGPTPQSKRRSIAKNDVNQISQSLDFYKKEYGTFPSGNIFQIMKILSGSNQRGIVFITSSTLSEDAPIDPWGHQLLIDLSNSNSRSRVWSMGPDGINQGGKDGSDDLASWN